jgi:radical SAM superfamily enzyme YgiQ (UPF0313 family)
MRVLIISTNTLPAAPTGPAYIAGAARQAGHEVDVYECLFAHDLEQELAAKLGQFQPEVIGLSIRLVHGDVQDPSAPCGTRYVDLRPRVREVAEIIRRNCTAQIVLGGPGFNYYARDWLEYLGLEYGIRGEGEEAFPRFVNALSEDGAAGDVPGCVTLTEDRFRTAEPCRVERLDDQALPAYDLFAWEQYAQSRISPAVFTKRGCAFGCTFCPYAKLEGKRYRLKSPERVLAEVRHTLQLTGANRVMFCDNSFNVPRRHAEALCRAFLAGPLDFQWGTGDLKPVNVDEAFCRLMQDSGCFYANLSIESASDPMLRRMKRGYTARQVRQALEALCRSGLPFGASLMFGAPGETPETIAETLSVLKDYPLPLGAWVTIGVYLWTDYQDLVSEARRDGLLDENESLFDGPVYLSPTLPVDYLYEFVSSLRGQPGYTVQVNRSDRISTMKPLPF